MQLYTKTGDKGMTKLIGGGKVSKDSDRVWAYGTIDELNTQIGVATSELPITEVDLRSELQELQSCLFDLGTDLANPNCTEETARFDKNYIGWLEKKIDQYAVEPPKIDRFVLPGGSKASSALQVCRSVTRRAERLIVTLGWSASIPAGHLIFVNRLSDYFYALARVVNFRSGTEEIFYEKGNPVFH